MRKQSKTVELFDKLARKEITVSQFIEQAEAFSAEEMERLRRILQALGGRMQRQTRCEL
jgi:hypothetical protein